MRGGAIPIVLWGAGLLVLMIINLIWEGSQIQTEMEIYLLVAIFGTGLGLFLLRPESLRKGPPVRESSYDAVPRTSLAAMTLGIATGAMMFGVVFGKFLVFIGAGVWLLAAGRLLVELRAQRRSMRGEDEE